MTTPPEQLLSSLTPKEPLTEAERGRMRALLSEYAAMKPVRASEPMRSRGRLFILTYLHRPALASLAAALILVLGSGGVAYAAEGALPGDTLYAVKVRITEPVVTALTPAGTAQAAWQMTLAERRIDEAAALAQKGALASTTEATLAKRFNTAATAAATSLASEGGGTSATVSSTTFASQLAAYDSVLAHAGEEQSATTTLRQAIHVQISLLQGRADAHTALGTERSHASTSDTSAEALGLAADTSLKGAVATLGSAAATLTASSSASAAHSLGDASELIKEGQAKLKANDPTGAATAFQDALGVTTRLEVLSHAATTLKIDAFDPTSTTTSTSTPTRARDRQ